MTRVSQIIWPVVALLASFVAVFALTLVVFSDDRSEDPPVEQAPTEQASPAPPVEPPDTGMVIEVRGVKGLPMGSAPQTVANIVEVSVTRICLVDTLRAAGWNPEGEAPWPPEADGRLCRLITPEQRVDVKLVKHG